MTPDHRRYIVVETAIGVVINTVISIGFVYLVFGRMEFVPAAALVRDAAPQSFMIALMSTAVPTILTRRRVARGDIARVDGAMVRLPKSWVVRALVIAMVAVTIGTVVTAGFVMTMIPGGVSFFPALLGKAIYGAGLAAVIAPIVVRGALAD